MLKLTTISLSILCGVAFLPGCMQHQPNFDSQVESDYLAGEKVCVLDGEILRSITSAECETQQGLYVDGKTTKLACRLKNGSTALASLTSCRLIGGIPMPSEPQAPAPAPLKKAPSKGSVKPPKRIAAPTFKCSLGEKEYVFLHESELCSLLGGTRG